MATNNMLKFYRLGAEAMATKTIAVGAIWFNTDDNTIQIKTATGWEKYAGKLNNATWDAEKKKLTISKYDGSSIQLDFSDIASGASVSAALNALEVKLQTNIDGANAAAKAADDKAVAAQADADALEEALGSGFSKDSTVSAQLAAVKATADAAAVKTTVDAELAKKADADQVALDIAAAKKGAEDTAAADATSKANAAETAAKGHADGLNTSMDARVKILEAAIGEDGSVADAIKNAIEALDTPEAGVKGDGTHVDVTVKQVNGVITEVVVDESDIASAQALADEIADRAAAEEDIADRIAILDAAETGRVSVLESKVNALSSATHFLGVKESLPATALNGDIVIVGNKEYVWDDNVDGTNVLGKAGWIELGDTTAESGRITTLESLVGSKSVGTQIDEKIAALSDETKSSDDANLVKVTVSQADGNVTGVSLDDSKLDQAISDLDGKISANTAAHEANAAAIKVINETTVPGINGRLDGLDGDVARIDDVLDTLATSEAMTQLTNRVSANEAAIERLDGEQDTQNKAIATADAKGAQGIIDAAAALAEAQTKVKSVTGNADVNASTNDHAVSLSLNKATAVAQGDTKAVTAGAVYDALCWEEFE